MDNGEYKHFKNQYIDNITDNYFKPILDEVFSKYGKNINVMADVGCGNGLFTAYLKEKYDVKLLGFDASEYALECARDKGFDEVILNKDFSTNALQAEAGTFDFILNKDVLEHLIDPEFLIKEIYRILKDDGLFLLHVPNDFNLRNRIKFVFRNKIDMYYCPGAKQWNWPHIRFFTYEGIKELLNVNNFEIIENYSPYFTDRVPIINKIPGYMKIGRILARKYPSQFSQGITLLVKKRKKRSI